MNLSEAISMLRVKLHDRADPELAHAMRVCIDQYPSLIRELSSTRSQLQKCQTDRARIHAELRSLSKRRG